MVYTMLLLVLFSVILLIINYTSKYTWYFIMMIIGLVMSIFVSALYLAKIGNYEYPQSIFFSLDYKIFLHLAAIKINFYDITKLLTLGIALYVFTVPLFVDQFVTISYRRVTYKFLLKLAALALLPLFYIWFYHPETSFNFYIWINNEQSSRMSEWVTNFIKVIDTFNYVWIIGYLFYPGYLLYRHYTLTTIGVKKKQIVSLAISLLLLNISFVFLFILGPFKEIYIYSFQSSLLKFPNKIIISYYSYSTLPIIMLSVIGIIIFILLKYKGLDSIDFFKDFIIQKNVKGLNKNLRGLFHSFKNTLFTINILAQQAELELRSDDGMETIKRIQQISSQSLTGITRTLDSFKTISMMPVKRRIVDCIEYALKKLYINENIKIQKRYMTADVCACFDFNHMTEAMVNLLQNAVEAINSVKKNDGTIAIEVNAEHEWVIIRITDNGPGIKKSDVPRVFKPFYTTKSRQNNWGVGLSYVYRVIKAHLGFINVNSVEGEYTTFQILLPRIEGGEEI